MDDSTFSSQTMTDVSLCGPLNPREIALHVSVTPSPARQSPTVVDAPESPPQSVIGAIMEGSESTQFQAVTARSSETNIPGINLPKRHPLHRYDSDSLKLIQNGQSYIKEEQTLDCLSAASQNPWEQQSLAGAPQSESLGKSAAIKSSGISSSMGPYPHGNGVGLGLGLGLDSSFFDEASLGGKLSLDGGSLRQFHAKHEQGPKLTLPRLNTQSSRENDSPAIDSPGARDTLYTFQNSSQVSRPSLVASESHSSLASVERRPPAHRRSPWQDALDGQSCRIVCPQPIRIRRSKELLNGGGEHAHAVQEVDLDSPIEDDRPIGLGLSADTWKTLNLPSMVSLTSTPRGSFESVSKKRHGRARSISGPAILSGRRKGQKTVFSLPPFLPSDVPDAPHYPTDRTGITVTPHPTAPPSVLLKTGPRNSALARETLLSQGRTRSLPKHMDLTIFVRRRASSRGTRVSSIRVSRSAASPYLGGGVSPSLPTVLEESDRRKNVANLDLDDMAFFRALHTEYYTVLMGSSAFGRFWRRYLSAKQLSGIALVPTQNSQEFGDAQTEERLFRNFCRPRDCKSTYDWTQWAYCMAIGQPYPIEGKPEVVQVISKPAQGPKRGASTPTTNFRSSAHFDNEKSSSSVSQAQTHHRTTTTTDTTKVCPPGPRLSEVAHTLEAGGGLSNAPGELEFVETWSIARIALAVATVLASSVLLLVLYVVAGPEMPSSNIWSSLSSLSGATATAAASASSSSSSSSRVGVGALLALLLLMMNCLGLSVWVWLSWLLL